MTSYKTRLLLKSQQHAAATKHAGKDLKYTYEDTGKMTVFILPWEKGVIVENS